LSNPRTCARGKLGRPEGTDGKGEKKGWGGCYWKGLVHEKEAGLGDRGI